MSRAASLSCIALLGCAAALSCSSPQGAPLETVADGASGCAIQLGFTVDGGTDPRSVARGSTAIFVASATNVSAAPVLLEVDVPCPGGMVRWTGTGDVALDTFGACVQGACPEPTQAVSATLAPGEKLDLASGLVTLGKDACYELPAGTYALSFDAGFKDRSLLCGQANAVSVTVTP